MNLLQYNVKCNLGDARYNFVLTARPGTNTPDPSPAQGDGDGVDDPKITYEGPSTIQLYRDPSDAGWDFTGCSVGLARVGQFGDATAPYDAPKVTPNADMLEIADRSEVAVTYSFFVQITLSGLDQPAAYPVNAILIWDPELENEGT